jgi:spore germination protein YaaH
MRIKITLTVLLYALVCTVVPAQEPETIPVGIHQAESEYYATIFDSIAPVGTVSEETPAVLKSKAANNLTHMVYGWHPYWASPSAYLSYDYEALTHIAYFSYEVDTATGGFKTLRGWDTTPVIDYAHQRGVKVTLTVTNFGTLGNTALLADTVRQWNLIHTLINQLRARNGDGVNFDFESLPETMKENMVSFCRRAVRGIKAELPAAEISVATPAVNWSDREDLKSLAEICDYIIMMGYNYYWSGSTIAGPVAPLTGETYNVTRSIDEEYLAAGVPPGKLLLGVPWYGYDWPVESSVRKATATGKGISRTYISAEQLAETYGKTFDEVVKVPWFSYFSSTEWRQLWYDDSLSLSLKYGLAKSKGLAGIGIWALSYEAGRDELWQGLKAAFSTGGSTAIEVINMTPNPLTDKPTVTEIMKITPNPVTDESVISYSISERCHATLRIYDTGGRLIVSLVDRTTDEGFYDEPVKFDTFGSGTYICVLQTPSGRSSVKFAVIKNR